MYGEGKQARSVENQNDTTMEKNRNLQNIITANMNLKNGAPNVFVRPCKCTLMPNIDWAKQAHQ